MCGIFGIVSNEEVVSRVVSGIYDLQHRGEQAVGIAVSDGKELKIHKKTGLVTEVFNSEDREEILKKLSGKFGIGHTLYSTVGKKGEEKQSKTFQPLVGDFHGELFAVSHNGNLIETEALRERVKEKGYQFESETSDTEVIVALISTSSQKDFLVALLEVLPELKGAFALTILFKNKVIGTRDKCGIRPLCLGRDRGSFMLASESCAFYTQGANFIREIQPGEVIILGEKGIENSFSWTSCKTCSRFCIFEFIYFARPDTKFAGQSVFSYREKAGELLAKECPVEADMIIPVPDSGRIYNDAFSRISGIPVKEALFKNRYFSTRTFLASRETDRRTLQRIKLHPLREVVHGKKVCVIEDSIIRANVSPEVVAMLREEGAREVHMRVCSSPIRFPCFLGIDIPDQVELVASNLTPEEIAKRVICCDSLGYLSLKGMIKASGLPKENLCLGCFTGDYPVKCQNKNCV